MSYALLVFSLALMCAAPVVSRLAWACNGEHGPESEKLDNCEKFFSNTIVQITTAIVYYHPACGLFSQDLSACVKEQSEIYKVCHGKTSCEVDASLSIVDLPGCEQAMSNVLYIEYECFSVDNNATVTTPVDAPFQSANMVILNQGFDQGIAAGPKSHTCRIQPASTTAEGLLINIGIMLVRFETTAQDCDESLELKTALWTRRFCSQMRSTFFTWNQQNEQIPLQEELTMTYSRIQDTPGKRFWIQLEGFVESGATEELRLTCTVTGSPTTTTTTDPTEGESNGGSSVNIGIIVGAVAAVVVLIVVVAVV